MNRKVACIGAGMTRFVRRSHETSGELAAQAVQMALDDAGMTIDEIDAVCLGTAPDAFDGIHMKGEHLIAGAGGSGKPYMRHYVGGGTGVMSPIHGWMHVASGKFKNVLVVTEEKMSPCNPHPAGAFLTIFDHTTEQPLELTLIHIFALEMARFMHVYGYTEEDIAQISVMHKRNAMDHPAAQIASAITVDDVMNSTMLSWPVKRFDISPTSDGAVAIILSNEREARSRKETPVFIDGVGYRLDTAYWCSRDLAYPDYVAMAAQDAYKMAGITDPVKDIDIFEPYDPFDYKALHHMNGLLLDKTGRSVKELLFSGAFERDGSHPMCPSGGALGVGNPIAATGLMKIAELYFQLSGQAGKRQVKKTAHRGVAQAWGDLMQVGTVVVMSSEGGSPNTLSRWNSMTAKDLSGTPIKENSKVPMVHETPDLRYEWDNGAALTTYLDGFKKGKLRGSYCSRCGRMMIPVRCFCEICNLAPVNDHFDLPDTGTVMTYTISNVAWDSSLLPQGTQNIFAVIAIDGAAEHMGLVHRLGNVKSEDVKIGMRVRAVWKKAELRKGEILDIEHFEPIPKKAKISVEIKPIKPSELTNLKAGSFPGKIPMKYRYTAGVAGTEFYQDLAKGKITGTWIETMDETIVPPAIFDEISMEPNDVKKAARNIDAKDGMIQSYSVVYEDRSGEALDDPAIIAQVSFPNVTGSIFGYLKLKKSQTPCIGAEVVLVKKKKINGPDDIEFKLK
jgi:acetyl-CoA C-acetyltransferase